jgi:lipoprotein-releasing system permease protein
MNAPGEGIVFVGHPVRKDEATPGCAAGFVIVPNLNEIVSSIESIFGIVAFPSDVYYLDRLPSKIQYMDSFLIIIFSVVICLVASLYPAWRASKLDLVDGLRYE